MNPVQFIEKWAKMRLKETQADKPHFADVCRMLGHKTPEELDPNGEFFCYQKELKKASGEQGYADVWYKDRFAWEYKGKHKNLDEAYTQVQLYLPNLGNPQLIVVCDFERYRVYTNFNNAVTKRYDFTSADITSGKPVGDSKLTALEILHALFFEPSRLDPKQTPEKLTRDAAGLLEQLVTGMEKWGQSNQEIAHFIMRMIFCLFAVDVGLLPKECFSDLLRLHRTKPKQFQAALSELLDKMRTGGMFGPYQVLHFNGWLFNNASAPELITDQIDLLAKLDGLDWSGIEPSIFGTLFERILDPAKRKQLGAHYTSREDIELVVKPVLMRPLQREWESAQAKAQPYLAWSTREGEERAQQEAALTASLTEMLERLGRVRVLDPACGSGNFLYVSMALLKELELEVLRFGATFGIGDLPMPVHPRQFLGLEVNPYAWELASVVVWIGYLQWRHRMFPALANEDPILQPLTSIKQVDAVLQRNGKPSVPEWPEADVIVGNPPFSGSRKLRRDLSDEYVEALFEAWNGRVSREADYCCYWFEQARAAIEAGRAKRAGLLATQAIRGGANRKGLERIKATGDIFMAYADRKWVLDGAAVQVSMVGFDSGVETERTLEGKPEAAINADLTAGLDLTRARRLKENLHIAFQGANRLGAFDVDPAIGRQMLKSPNPHGKSNSDVVRLWLNGSDVTGRPRGKWIIDFGEINLEQAAMYEAPFEYVKKTVYPIRSKNRRKHRRDFWWLHGETVPGLRAVIRPLTRFIATSAVGKHRFYIWVQPSVLPDHAVIAFARDDAYAFGILHSRAHNLWALRKGTQLREFESGFRYTPRTAFETFPFPWPLGQEPKDDLKVEAIAEAARELNARREAWLNPPDMGESALKKRTLTNLYNQRPQWLINAHRKLDRAVFDAYGWPHDIGDDDMLTRLLALNTHREPA